MNEDLEYQLYKRLCSHCPNAKQCHEECETCETFDEELGELTKDGIKV